MGLMCESAWPLDVVDFSGDDDEVLRRRDAAWKPASPPCHNIHHGRIISAHAPEANVTGRLFFTLPWTSKGFFPPSAPACPPWYRHALSMLETWREQMLARHEMGWMSRGSSSPSCRTSVEILAAQNVTYTITPCLRISKIEYHWRPAAIHLQNVKQQATLSNRNIVISLAYLKCTT